MAAETNLDLLIGLAKRASERAYCPYSRFRVGAVVATQSGELFAGCNVENASYGLTICAERNAIFQMIAHGQHQIEQIVVYTPTPVPAAPCGACRQTISEFSMNARIVCVCDGSRRIDTTLDQLLPHAFGQSNLGND